MTGSRLLSKLLRFKGFRVVSWWFEGRSCFVIAVKPHKNGCCCPECGRRGKIVRTMPICVGGVTFRCAGGGSGFSTILGRFGVLPTVVWSRRFRGRSGSLG